MKLKSLLSLTLLCLPTLAFATNVQVGSAARSVSVDAHGELLLEGDTINYSAWKSAQMLGKVRVIQAIAGRSSSKKMNAPLMAAITAEKFPEDSYQTTTVINQDDAMWGTGSFVKSSAEDSKKEFPWSSMVLDEHGLVANAWQLEAESSAIIVQDKSGKVLFVKEGVLSDDELNTVLELIKQNL
ncbi:YtfJ family protein [Vibrio methylphosphonaticus]|uniref:YtfJ family protein n=1 Tax=Vibrio methylphosphonaticus TaxID=2946866 RepID=UPI002029B976|nr:YtfJ family protein [Vibrio methylphosphonaticus]MCL9777085.1 YtfJ family protein [Vibrio methylphosphonaticus]